MIHMIISILFMIGQHKFILLIGINELVLWFYKKIFTFYHFLESKFICQLRQTWIHIKISFLFMIGHHKHILLIRINDNDAIFHKKNFSFDIFTINVHLSTKMNMNSHNNHLSFND